jgi:hypothetical protein
MAKVPDILYQGQPGAVNTDLYTVPAAKKATITGILGANTDAATKYFSLHLVQNGDAVANDVALAMNQKLVGTGDAGGGGVWTFVWPIPMNTAGDKISGIQETATAITVTIVGFEEDA